MTISHITEILSPDDIMTAMFEFTLKNHSRTHKTLMGLLLLPYMVTPITKQTSPLNSHQKPLRTYITLMGLPLLPYMVTPITKQTSPLNSHQKTTLEHIEHLCVCHYCHVWSLRSQNRHHH